MAIANSDGSIILTTKLDVTPVSKALNALKSKFASLKEQRSAIQSLTTAIKEQKFVIKNLEKEYAVLVSQGKGSSANAEELKARIAALKAELQQLTGAASAMGAKTAVSFTKAAQGLKKFGKRISSIIKSALIFSVLYKVMQAVVKLFQNVLMSDEEFRQDWEELKAAFYTAAYPIINLIVPAIKWIVQEVRDWAVSIGKVAAALQGMTYREMVDQAKASKEAAENYSDMEKSSKKTAENVKKQLASFDDIQILSSGNEEEQTSEISGFDGLGKYDTSGEKSMLADLMKTIGGALAAVGIILLFNGQISWGIGFIVAGAAFWGVSKIASKQFSESPIVNVLAKITESIGLSLAAVGLILLIKGQIAWGLAFVAAGAAMWGITEFAVGQFSEDPIANTLIKITGIAGTSLAALGIILLVFGQIPWGVAMLSAGAVMLVSAVALNSEAIVEAIRSPIGVIMAIAGASLLVLGIILTCTGNLMLGIPLIALGAESLVTPIALNWDVLVEKIRKIGNAISKIFSSVWDGIKIGFKFMVNGIIGLANLWIDGLNFILLPIRAIVLAISKAFDQNLTLSNIKIPHIPKLAQGTVVPPNKEFMAILGDNKNEHEIVSPISTMKQAFMEAMVEMGGNFSGGNTEVVLEIDGREFGRAVVEQGNRENRRIGTRLVIG